MPLTLRPKDTILNDILSHLLAGGLVSDIAQISVLRQLSEGVASTQADLDYDLYALLQGWYITSAEGVDLDLRGLDHNLARDAGQAASDPVTLTPLATWIDDIALPEPTVVQATLADGTLVLYRSLADATLMPSGRSVSAQAPATILTSGVNDTLALNLDGDGVRTIALGTQTTAVGIAAAIQAAVQALTAINAAKQVAYTQFRCDYAVTTSGAYTLRSGTVGVSSTCVVTVAGAADASASLKLGTMHGGTEAAGQASLSLPVLCDRVGTVGNVGAGQINTLVNLVPGVSTVTNPLAFANGRDPASDDAYRQDIRSYLLSLGPGTPDAVERAVAHTVSADGQRHVMTSQVAYGTGTILAYVCDGRSLTVGAQPDVVQAVQDELEGRGERVGGWVPSGNTAGVVSATVVGMDVDVDVYVGPTPNLVQAQAAIRNALYTYLYRSSVGQLITALLLDGVIDAAVPEVFNILYRLPATFAVTPRGTVGGGIGQKVMPGVISVHVSRAS